MKKRLQPTASPIATKSRQRRKPLGPISPKSRVNKPLYYSDLDPSQWREYPDIETDSLWQIAGRDRQNGHQLDYHGNCVPQILTQLVTRYTKKGDILLDLFLGSGTSAIECANLERRSIGVELKPELANAVREKLQSQGKEAFARILHGDSTCMKQTGKAVRETLAAWGETHTQFLFLHPPYADIIQFSDLEADLSNAPSTEGFLEQFERVCRVGYEFLEPGRFAAVVIGDKYTDGELIPLGFYCMERMNRTGFKTKSIIVKNITGNEKAKGRMNNLWRFRALKGGFYVFKHEYVILFQKPLNLKTK